MRFEGDVAPVGAYGGEVAVAVRLGFGTVYAHKLGRPRLPVVHEDVASRVAVGVYVSVARHQVGGPRGKGHEPSVGAYRADRTETVRLVSRAIDAHPLRFRLPRLVRFVHDAIII